jgi:hypothetical protein
MRHPLASGDAVAGVVLGDGRHEVVDPDLHRGAVLPM